MGRASSGDPASQYELARWHENYCDAIQAWIVWQCETDVRSGYVWLEKAADQDYPPAVYMLGVRLKYGEHVPRPAGWNGPEGNWFPQPERGQELIDRAIRLGFRPYRDERIVYMRIFRGSH
jgi:TPR repeat protein